MLGEDHSLYAEFPKLTATINSLVETDESFKKDAALYHELDIAIRGLELDGSPISDSDMHQKKHDRAVLKDTLYQRLLEAQK